MRRVFFLFASEEIAGQLKEAFAQKMMLFELLIKISLTLYY